MEPPASRRLAVQTIWKQEGGESGHRGRGVKAAAGLIVSVRWSGGRFGRRRDRVRRARRNAPAAMATLREAARKLVPLRPSQGRRWNPAR